MSGCETTTSATQVCVVCPAIPAVEGVPEQRIERPNNGWNAVADSHVQLAGDCYTEFTVPAVVGVAIGFSTNRSSLDPRSISHGFYIYQAGGRNLWAVHEHGIEKTTPAQRYVPFDKAFRIERRGSVVSFLYDNALVYRSRVGRHGVLSVVACLYASGDGVD